MNHREIRIGALYPLTGGSGYVGQSIRQALEFYVDLVNSGEQIPPELGIPDFGRTKIKLIWADTEGEPLIAVSEAKRLIQKEGVTSMIGSYDSSVSAAVSLQTEIMNIPYLSPDTDAEFLTRRGLKWFFRTGQTDVSNTAVYFNMLNKKGFHSSTIGSLAGNSMLGQDEALAVINLARCNRYQVTALQLYDPISGVSEQDLLNIERLNPNFLFATQSSDGIIKTIRFFKSTDYYPMAVFFQTSTASLNSVLEPLGDDANYIFSAVAWAYGLTKELPLAHTVNSMYRRRYGENLNSINARSFTGIYTLIDAIARADSDDPKSIRAAIADTDIPGSRLIVPWRGICFDQNGQNAFADSMIVQILQQESMIVWPNYLAQTDPVLPVPPWCRR